MPYDGRDVGGKARPWRPLAGLPRAVPQPCTAVVAAHPADAADLDALTAGGLVPARPAAVATPAAYRSFVQQSAGELSVAQEMYSATACGWTSDRTAAYLAAGPAGRGAGHRLRRRPARAAPRSCPSARRSRPPPPAARWLPPIRRTWPTPAAGSPPRLLHPRRAAPRARAAGRGVMHVLLAGRVVGQPDQGGATWAVLQWVLGLRALGHRVTVVEQLPAPPTPRAATYARPWSGRPVSDAAAGRCVRRPGRGRSARSTCWSTSPGSCATRRCWPPRPPRSTSTSTRASPRSGTPRARRRARRPHPSRHRRTAAGAPDCPVPTVGLDWLPVLPPVVLDRGSRGLPCASPPRPAWGTGGATGRSPTTACTTASGRTRPGGCSPCRRAVRCRCGWPSASRRTRRPTSSRCASTAGGSRTPTGGRLPVGLPVLRPRLDRGARASRRAATSTPGPGGSATAAPATWPPAGRSWRRRPAGRPCCRPAPACTPTPTWTQRCGAGGGAGRPRGTGAGGARRSPGTTSTPARSWHRLLEAVA
jgi:hypothetical protein